MTANEVQYTLATAYWDYTKQIVIPNSYFLGDEADLLVLQKSGWLEEVEVKVSASDFRKEFEDGNRCKNRKHQRMAFCDEDRLRRYWFAVPEELVPKVKDLVPPYAGLLSVGGCGRTGYVRVVKQAPKLQKARALTVEEQLKLCRLGYIRLWPKFLK